MTDVAATPLADGPGETYIGLVLMSGLCLAPMIMLGLGAWAASGSRRGRRIAVGISVVIVLFYGLSVLGSHFSWPDLRFHGEIADAALLTLLACGGFLSLPWLLAFGVTKFVKRGTPTPESSDPELPSQP
ncbi:hypothetical protein [Actinoplanes xinjiangensis]|uniref:Uncharacterized protein n=1 Tax=Actinoplanes xinjiangensis TaxID=512350 RepID=A0A316E3J7_9ACTN|nr:hypothetical protein [Actinoplanes xinjiangensis]PWK25257.1 hypothetical protein BC793_1692 [Actinoplanes xinjiangensis]GIF45430.1 hypothetical protein Axi01nite_97410 [Actinoplanes xinjiangensis]